MAGGLLPAANPANPTDDSFFNYNTSAMTPLVPLWLAWMTDVARMTNRSHGLDFETAWRLSSYVAVSYCNASSIAGWNCTRCDGIAAGVQPEEVISDVAWDLQGFVGWSVPLAAIVVAFRGTDSHSIYNWVNNMRTWRTDLAVNYPGAPQRALVHGGFFYSYNSSSLAANVTAAVQRLLQRHPQAPVYVSGHSLGGALATLCALDLKLNQGAHDVRLYTYGSPRVGNNVFAEWFESQIKVHWRFTHNRDIVPSVPPGYMGFYHLSREVWLVDILMGHTLVGVCDDTGEDIACHNSMCHLGLCSSVSDHLLYLSEMYTPHPGGPAPPMMEAPQPASATQRPHKRLGSPQGAPLPSNKRTCKADVLRVGSLDSEGSPLGATAASAIDWAAVASGGAAGAAATPAGARLPMPPARGSAESSSSRLLDAPPTAAAETAPVPVPEAAASAADGWAPSDAAAAGGEAALVLPAQYLSELAAANACLKQLPLPGGTPYTPVHPCCAMQPLCCVYGVPPAAVALGASYFQRLLVGSEALRNSALQYGFFSFLGDEAVMHAQPGCPDLLTILCSGPSKLHEELPPITPLAVSRVQLWSSCCTHLPVSDLTPLALCSPPDRACPPYLPPWLQAEAEDNNAGWWRGDRPAAARAPASAAAAGAAGGSASILDALLATMGEGGGQAPMRNGPALPPLLPALPPAQRSPPGAPRSHAAPLPPPPEVPASVLAALRPASAPPAPVPRYGNARSGPSPAPAPTAAPATYSLVLQLTGTNLSPWSSTKAGQLLEGVQATLQAASLAVNGTDVVLVNITSSSASGRRLAAAAAAIPSMYALTQTAVLQVIVNSTNSSAALQSALVASIFDGTLAVQLRSAGLAVTQAAALSVYAGTASPPTGLTPLSPSPSPSPVPSNTTKPTSTDSGMPIAEIVGIAGGAGGTVILTGALLIWLKLRRSGSSADGTTPKEAKRSPAPGLGRASSATTVDLESATTPRFRQPITPRRSALKHSSSLGGSGSQRGLISLHAAAHTGFSFPMPPTGPQLVPGVHLMPRAPSVSSISGLRPNVARTMATVQSMREAQASQRAQQAERERAQQAAEQAAMRDYLRSRPPQQEQGEPSPLFQLGAAVSKLLGRALGACLATGAPPSNHTVSLELQQSPERPGLLGLRVCDDGLPLPPEEALLERCCGATLAGVAPLLASPLFFNTALLVQTTEEVASSLQQLLGMLRVLAPPVQLLMRLNGVLLQLEGQAQAAKGLEKVDWPNYGFQLLGQAAHETHRSADGAVHVTLQCAQPLSAARLVAGVAHLVPSEYRAAAERGKPPGLSAGYEARLVRAALEGALQQLKAQCPTVISSRRERSLGRALPLLSKALAERSAAR
ncbi:alpha beta-hydrolase [Chlorella sorokiniana]|uniref:Alpha beta-hydrolase n=1 Tax=Chlorella sorokiniana TaxID=3076 RepID=A0A2P6TIA2_CHLSO|nr:alpha beta-hydrolase [Chlorella sorokiniana]|eukprot:PRW34023.1 alpha beta-hydrolase [Chlorella sorokiniana]